MKKFYFWAPALAAILTMAACTAEDDIVVSSPDINPPNEETPAPILFSSLRSNITRAGADITGAEAAALLGNRFVVSGYKGQNTASVGNIVFDNYVVEYQENTAYTTESNVRNWEYVGKGRIKHAIDNGITQQTIKYWDYSQPQYDFIAWSTGSKTAIYEGTPATDQVLVSAITPTTATGTANDRVAYTFTGKAADLKDCFIADLVTVKKAKYSKATGENPVTIRFRNLGTKVRIGIYETVPGYSVRNVKFYTTGGILTNVDEQIVDNATIFSAGADIYTEGKYTIYFPTVDDEEASDNNLAHIKFEPKEGVQQTTTVEWGALNYTIAEDGEKTAGSVYLGRSSNTASFAGSADDNYYVTYLPNETGTNLNLRVDFVLESTDGSGEVINVKNAKAQVPSIYATWKPGFAYTYLFKISDKTNGRTGVYDPTQADDATVNSDPAGLFPITFDAVVVNSEEDATQETITTISTPSITTYQKGSKVVDNDEYLAATGDIYVTVNEGDNIVTLTNKAALYTLPTDRAYTEAEVVDALAMRDDNAAANTVKGRSGLVLTKATSTLTDRVEYGADGNVIKIETEQALKFTPAAGTYAFVYTKEAATKTTDMYQPVSVQPGESVAGLYRGGLKSAGTGDVQKGVVYFKSATSGKITVFIGQGVSNLYLDSEGKTIAKGNAVTGTDYYYTVNNGMSYSKAEVIAYADFATAGLYVRNENNEYLQTSDTTPTDGTAYYKQSGEGTAESPYVYTYCVIYPQQADGLMVYKTETKWACKKNEVAYDGMLYFDKFSKNNGEYYTKVIKVQ